MASKDRIKRLKDETRINILEASLNIAKEEGWNAVSMRKIAGVIEYTAPVIYEYFASKEALLLELTKRGYLILLNKIKEAKSKHQLPARQVEAMWFAYWKFSVDYKVFYQLMFGVEINCCCDLGEILPESQAPACEFREVITKLMNVVDPADEMVCLKYYTLWSVVHGLISINLLKRGHSAKLNNQILKDAISGIINSIGPTAHFFLRES